MPSRLTYLLGLVTISALLLTSVYLQLFAGFVPCPLCILQRISFVLLGLLFLIGMLLHAKRWSRWTVGGLSTLVSLLGIFLAGRQVWLQHFPPVNASECGVSLQYMMRVLPMNEVLQKIFAGSAECTQRGWEFLNFTMAEWSFIWFIMFFIFSLFLLIKEYRT